MAKSHLFLAALALGAALSTAAQAQDTTAATVVAKVNGVEITLGHMIIAREALSEQYKSLPNETLFTGILDQLIQQTALEQTVANKLKLTNQLQLDHSRRDYLANVALTEVVMGAVTDEALQAAYDTRFKDYAPQKEFSAAHILVDVEEKANELRGQLDGGADFAKLAKANSTDTGSGANGGDLGWFGIGQMVKPFEDAVVAAEIGKVAGPIKSDFGWHLILVKETRIAEKPTLEAMREELASELQNRAIDAHIKAVTEAATVERMADGVDPALLSDTALLEK
jgi:peptidyl-prolyl cis-trans isomerase C